VEEQRRELFVLFKNIAKLAFDSSLAAVGAMLQAAISRPDSTFQVRALPGAQARVAGWQHSAAGGPG
jgi:hypothetical protein